MKWTSQNNVSATIKFYQKTLSIDFVREGKKIGFGGGGWKIFMYYFNVQPGPLILQSHKHHMYTFLQSKKKDKDMIFWKPNFSRLYTRLNVDKIKDKHRLLFFMNICFEVFIMKSL